jgi:two-component system CheB/CheR fusion protein
VTVEALLRRYAPSGALVDEHGEIRYLHGRTGQFLEPSPGDAGMNILRMAREGLRRELTTALHRAVTERQAVHHAGVRVKSNGDFVTANLEVMPVASSDSTGFETTRFLITFEPCMEADAGAGADAGAVL